MDVTTITVADFKTQFPRDFPYAPAGSIPDLLDDKHVQDTDISRAFIEAQAVFNDALFGADPTVKMAYLYCTAHFLVNDLRAALGGIEGTGLFPILSRSVGSVSESYAIPKSYQDDPLLAMYTTTPYGMKYLTIALPNLVGNIVTVAGTTLP